MPLDLAYNSQTQLSERFAEVRARSVALAAPLSPEDWMLQSMQEASPVKWHLAHTSWFFETFILNPYKEGYQEFHPHFRYLFNSYYNTVGEMHTRAERGMISRPSASDVLEYRTHVTSQINDLLANKNTALEKVGALVLLGCIHEEQHQELLLTDIKHALSMNPIWPAAYEECDADQSTEVSVALEWISFEGGLSWIGHSGDGFAFDNEGPRHQVFLTPFELANRLVTNAEYLAFIEDDGYSKPEYWLADGWETITSQNWRAPLYWRETNGDWSIFTLFGEKPLLLDDPVTHLSYYEAAAYAEWTGFRLPTEFEWERASKDVEISGNLLSGNKVTAPRPARGVGENSKTKMLQLYGDAWEWTASPYVAYPGFRAPEGAIGEYNAKFMSSQMVLRGGSCATPQGHIRSTYRNFFPPNARWQFSGVRLARDV